MRDVAEFSLVDAKIFAELEARKSNDPDTKVGAVLMHRRPVGMQIVGDKHDLNYAYMFAARGHNYIVTRGDDANLQRPAKYPKVIHAEVMAIGLAAQMGRHTAGATLYVTHPPCQACAAVILAAGIKRVVIGSGQYQSNTEENRINAEFLLADIEVVHETDCVSS